MKSNLNFILGIALCIMGYYGYKSFRERPKNVPTIQLQNMDRSEAVIPKSEPTIYILWTTWCPACSSVLSKSFFQDPSIKSRVVLVNDGEDPELVAGALQQRAYPFQSLLDPKRNFARAMKANSYPSIYIQNKAGKISKFELGTVYRPSQVVGRFQEKLFED